MSFTGVLGTSESMLGNIVLGIGASSPPPPPPPTDAQVKPPAHNPMHAGGPFGGFSPAGMTLRLVVPLWAFPRADLLAQAAEDSQVRLPVNAPPPVMGPWQRLPFAPAKTTWLTVSPDGIPTVPPPPEPPHHMHIVSAVKGPWNRFGLGGTYPTVSPPTVPPPPPATGTHPFGPARREVMAVPRVPRTTDDRLRQHIDKVADILTSLLRRGFIRLVGDGQFDAGGMALPRAPAATDDSTVGAYVSMTFVDTTTNAVYVCVNNSVGSAVWVQVGG